MSRHHAVLVTLRRALFPALWCAVLALWPIRAASASTAPGPSTPRLSGRMVQFTLSGVEPDFDPIDRLVIAARLYDPHPVAGALPATTLILSLYLENFQPSTTPILPDVLHPDRQAMNLGGFLQGKAALVDGAGRIRYRGGLLAEVFLDNTVHAVIDLDPQGALAARPALRLRATFTLHKDLTLAGVLRVDRPLAPSEVAALHVARPHPVAWQAVVRGMAVHRPPMLGTGGAGGAGTRARVRAPVAPPRRPAPVFVARPAPAHAVATGDIVLALLPFVGLMTLLVLLWRRRTARATSTLPV